MTFKQSADMYLEENACIYCRLNRKEEEDGHRQKNREGRLVSESWLVCLASLC